MCFIAMFKKGTDHTVDQLSQRKEEFLNPLLQWIFIIPIFQHMVCKARIVIRFFNINWLFESWNVNQIGI